MRIALFIIMLYLARLIDKANTMPGLLIGISFCIGTWFLLRDYLGAFDAKGRKK